MQLTYEKNIDPWHASDLVYILQALLRLDLDHDLQGLASRGHILVTRLGAREGVYCEERAKAASALWRVLGVLYNLFGITLCTQQNQPTERH